METPNPANPANQPGSAPSPRDCVTAELPLPLGVIAHRSVEHTDGVIAAVGIGLQIKLPKGQQDYLVAGQRWRLHSGTLAGPRAQELSTSHLLHLPLPLDACSSLLIHTPHPPTPSP